jgi:hypothetical protein
MTGLTYTRSQDGEHRGRPCYEYTATSADRTYNIVWASDHGGMFGYTAVRKDAEGRTEYLTERSGIVWARTLKWCKAQIEKIERAHNDDVPA